MIKCFSDLIERSVEVYDNNIMVKIRQTDSLVHALRETFDKLKANSIKLNPGKCVFDVLEACCSVSWFPGEESR